MVFSMSGVHASVWLPYKWSAMDEDVRIGYSMDPIACPLGSCLK